MVYRDLKSVNVGVLENDYDTALTLNFTNIPAALEYMQNTAQTEFSIDIGDGDFLDAATVPENVSCNIKGVHPERSRIGDIHWIIGPNKKLVIEKCFMQNLIISDGSTFTTNSAIIFRDCHINNIIVTGNIKPRIICNGPLPAAGSAITALPLTRIDGYIQASGCTFTLHNMAANGSIYCNNANITGSKLDGYVFCDGYACEFVDTNFNNNFKVTFTGPVGIVYVGPIANYKFHQANGTIVNGSLNIMDNLLQNNSNEIAVNTTTTSTSFVDLISTTITTKTGSKLLLNFTTSASCSSANTTMFFRLMVDGVAKRGGGTRYIGAPSGSVAISQAITGLAAGSHTIKVQWKVGAATGQIRPVAAPDSESACLTIMETLV